MKRLIILCLVLTALTGCVSVKYNAESKEVHYQRIGPQRLSGVLVEAPDGTSILIEGQESDLQIIKDILEAAK